MVIKKLEKPKSLEQFIEGGGDVVPKRKEWTNFTLRIRKDLLKNIDKSLEDRVGISTTAWILEAIQEKLRKE